MTDQTSEHAVSRRGDHIESDLLTARIGFVAGVDEDVGINNCAHFDSRRSTTQLGRFAASLVASPSCFLLLPLHSQCGVSGRGRDRRTPDRMRSHDGDYRG